DVSARAVVVNDFDFSVAAGRKCGQDDEVGSALGQGTQTRDGPTHEHQGQVDSRVDEASLQPSGQPLVTARVGQWHRNRDGTLPGNLPQHRVVDPVDESAQAPPRLECQPAGVSQKVEPCLDG